jgi:hypothetical protein
MSKQVKAILGVGSFLVSDSGCVKVTKGKLVVYEDGKFSNGSDTATRPVTYDEVTDAHDGGAVVYEATEEYKGLWR